MGILVIKLMRLDKCMKDPPCLSPVRPGIEWQLLLCCLLGATIARVHGGVQLLLVLVVGVVRISLPS